MATKNYPEREFVRCIDCKKATFMQWFENPVIALCSDQNERLVAASRRLCRGYVPSENPNPDVQHFDHYDTK